MKAMSDDKEMSEAQKELLGLMHWIRGFKSTGTPYAAIQPISCKPLYVLPGPNALALFYKKESFGITGCFQAYHPIKFRKKFS